MSEERFRAILDQNVMTAFFTCRAFLRIVRETGRGDIVLVSSTSALFGEAGNADYAAAKSAIAFGFARTLKNEIVRIAPRGRVNVVAPGWTLTPAAEASLTKDVVEAATMTMPLKKIATPDDVARTIVWLTSPIASAHCTGQIVEVAGGMEGRVVPIAP
jgi:3-oxoacyl-[acyl-carrier protein] reductase